MKNLILAVTMEVVYQVIRREIPRLTRPQCAELNDFPRLCWYTICDPEAAKKRFF